VRPERSERNRWVALLLCFFGGFLGLHRFYVGKVGSGVWYLLTCGFFFFGAVADFFCILLGSFRDHEGLPLR
jgi:TM2 domain-containing membrane protein YozV